MTLLHRVDVLKNKKGQMLKDEKKIYKENLLKYLNMILGLKNVQF